MNALPSTQHFDLTRPQDHARVVMATVRILARRSVAKEWVTRDEYGSWEKRAAFLSERTATKRIELGLSDAEWTRQIADQIILEALKALLARSLRSAAAVYTAS